MLKRLLSLLLVMSLLLCACPIAVAEETAAVAQCRKNKELAHQLAECARALGYAEDSAIIRQAQERWRKENEREKELKKAQYTQADLDLLSRLIYAEAGCTWIPDWVQQMVGSVVLNRVASSYYPDSIREVVYQSGQYGPVYNGSIHNTPDARTVANARYLLENGSVCPSNVTGQSGSVTGGGVYKSYYDSVLGVTMYFCYT